MKRLAYTLGALALVSACAPAVPDSAAGVGFDDYNRYQAERAARDRALQGGGSAATVPAAASVQSAPLTATGPVPSGTSDVEATAEAALAAANSGQAPVQASPSNPAPAAVTNPNGISAENDFTAVSSERSIQDDAARIAQNRATYQQVAPTALPTRGGDDGPNIVTYAIETTNPLGQKVYTRVGFNAEARMRRNCAKYPSADMAQRAFLSNGGPQRDRLGLDPDGDGYACSWDPRPFRAAARSGG